MRYDYNQIEPVERDASDFSERWKDESVRCGGGVGASVYMIAETVWTELPNVVSGLFRLASATQSLADAHHNANEK